MKTKILFLLAFSVLLIAGCGQLERDNPYDPLKTIAPEKPTGLQLIRQGDLKNLKWNVNTDYCVGYNVYRRSWDQSVASKIATITTTSNYTDPANTALYANHYYYAVSAYTDKAESSRTSEVFAGN